MLKGEKIWLDGEFVNWDEATVHVMTHTLHYGLGAFEGIRAYETHDGRTAIFRLHEHVRRLRDSAHIALMDNPYSHDQVANAIIETVRINHFKSCYIRPLLFLGHGAMGLGAVNPTRLAIAAFPWGAYLGEEGIQNGIRAKVSSFARTHVNTNMSKGKICGHYVTSILAKREVQKAGYEEAIMLDTHGFVAEGTGENIFMVRDGMIKTPPLGASILAGVTREVVVRIVRDIIMAENPGVSFSEELFSRDQLYTADEVLVCGTAAEITPIREVDDRRIGLGKPGPITRRVQEIFFRIVRGQEPRYQDWLTFV
ncbi:MAG: Branched-chain-amino-acid aminotransferase [Myxococcota bacterium]|nr:Branched-chain-amino-acid aminotransferase [Myxococcota bacterium]